MRRLLTAALVAGALLVAAGCGGEEEPTDAGGGSAAAERVDERSSAPLDAKTFRAEVVELCEAAADEAREDTAGLPEPEVIAERIIATSRRYQRKFEELKPPASLRKLTELSLAEGRLGIVVFEKFREEIWIGTDPIVASRRLTERLRPLIRRSKETARRMGVPECARRPSESAQEA